LKSEFNNPELYYFRIINNNIATKDNREYGRHIKRLEYDEFISMIPKEILDSALDKIAKNCIKEKSTYSGHNSSLLYIDNMFHYLCDKQGSQKFEDIINNQQ
jgi:hypothetical protein